eukprot:scaffold14476_cov120-Isochrysis_galbana.AAC.5
MPVVISGSKSASSLWSRSVSVMRHSVVSREPLIEAAFSSAHVVTEAGSAMPASSRFSYSSVLALKP